MDFSCGDCKWWVQDQSAEGRGSCHRYPPVPILEQYVVNGDVIWEPSEAYPVTDSDDFCGEHQQREMERLP